MEPRRWPALIDAQAGSVGIGTAAVTFTSWVVPTIRATGSLPRNAVAQPSRTPGFVGSEGPEVGIRWAGSGRFL
jgi:hypothetical protein